MAEIIERYYSATISGKHKYFNQFFVFSAIVIKERWLLLMKTKIPKDAVEKYLKKRYKKAKILEYKKLGSGWHGSGYKITARIDNRIKAFILRTKNNINFSYDYSSDRAASFMLSHQLANRTPKHIKSLDVVGIAKNKNTVSVGNCHEFFQLVEPAKGKEYMEDLKRIKNKNRLEKNDKEKALTLSDYLVKLHKIKFKGNKEIAASVYKRHLRDCIGSGEMLIGVFDTYPDKISFAKEKEVTDIIKKSVELREKLKYNCQRLCRIHGDFHPGNILWDKKGLIVMDASRELYGDPADDLTSMAINYIWFSLMHKGNFSGYFKELFDIFWGNYIRKTKDYEINKIAPLFFSFRGIVVAHPLFYKDQTNETRRKIFNFINNILDGKRFDCKKINSYIE